MVVEIMCIGFLPGARLQSGEVVVHVCMPCMRVHAMRVCVHAMHVCVHAMHACAHAMHGVHCC